MPLEEGEEASSRSLSVTSEPSAYRSLAMPGLFGLRAMQASTWAGVVLWWTQASWQARPSLAGDRRGAMSSSTRGPT